MGILADAPFGVGDAHLGQQVHGVLTGFVAGLAHVELDGLGELAVKGEHRVQRGHGFLEHHGHLGATDAAHIVHVNVKDVFPVEKDFSAHGLAGGIGDQAHQRQRAYALAAAGLAHQAEGFAGHDFVGDVVNGFDDAFVGEEVRLQVLDFKQRVHGNAPLSLLGVYRIDSTRAKGISAAQKFVRSSYHTADKTAR